MSRLRKFFALSGLERVQFLQAMGLLIVIGAALKILPFRTCRASLARLSLEPAGEVDAAALRRARTIASLVHAAGKHGPAQLNCLRESLVLWYMLRRTRIPTDLRIGVRKAGADLEAHAWVEAGGRVLNDASDVHERFTAFARSVGDT